MQRGDRRRAQRADPLGSGPRRHGRADPRPSGSLVGAAPPPPGGLADARRTRPGVGRAARGPPLLPPHRLRRERHQSLPRVRDDSRPGPPGDDPGQRRRRREALRQGRQQGDRQGHLQDGDLDGAELPRRAGLRGAGTLAGLHRRVLHGNAHADQRNRDQRDRARGASAARMGLPEAPRGAHDARDRRPLPVPPGRRGPPQHARGDSRSPDRLPHGRLQALQAVQRARQPAGEAPGDAPGPDGLPPAREGRPARGGGARRGDPRPVQDGRHVVRLHQPGSARGACDRHEPDRRKEQHGRGRRGSGPLRDARGRRLEEQRHQAGRLGAVRRDEPVPREGPRAPDQDRAGRQAGRGRPAPGSQGLSVDRAKCGTRRREWD